MAARLCRAEREEIRVGLELGWSYRRIAAVLGRHPSTVQREVVANGGRGRYAASRAHLRSVEAGKRPRRSKLATDPVLCARVREGLTAFSPAPLVKLLNLEGLQVSHETIYRELFRDDTALPGMWRHLARARHWRRRRHHRPHRTDPNPLGSFRLVTERTAVLPDEPGHWEGDLIIGSRNKSAAIVLTERSSRQVILGALDTQTATEVTATLINLLAPIPPQARHTLCWDQGRELAHWKHVEATIGTTIYFCQPRSPWQKPLVENTCGILRRWLPPNTTITNNQHQLDNIAQLLNTTPRRILDWNTPDHHYRQLVATTS